MDILKPSKKEEYSCNIRTYGNLGGTVPGNYVHVQSDVVAPTIKETTLYDTHGNIGNQLGGAYAISDHQSIENQRDTTNTNTIGNAGGSGSKYGTRSYESNYRQTNNESKEKSIASRTNQGNAKMFNPSMNVSQSKLDSDRDNNRLWAPSAVIQSGPSIQSYGKVHMPQYNDTCKIGCDRISGDLLNAFKSNPYTHSLTYAV